MNSSSGSSNSGTTVVVIVVTIVKTLDKCDNIGQCKLAVILQGITRTRKNQGGFLVKKVYSSLKLKPRSTYLH